MRSYDSEKKGTAEDTDTVDAGDAGDVVEVRITYKTDRDYSDGTTPGRGIEPMPIIPIVPSATAAATAAAATTAATRRNIHS